MNTKNSWLFAITIAIFIISILGIILIVKSGKTLAFGDCSDVYEKDVSFFYVYSNNMFMILKMYFFGLFTIGVYAIISIIHNVVGVGFIANQLYSVGYDKMVYKMIPHGILEFLGMSFALGTVVWMWGKLFQELPYIIKRKKNFSEAIKGIIVTMIFSVVVNAIIFFNAGIIEVIVSHYKVLK